MEPREYLRILRKSWILLVSTTSIGLALAAGFTATRTPVYQASSTVFVSTQAGSTAAELQQGSSFTQARINTYVGLAATPVVLEPVISELKLPDSSDELAERITASAALNSTLITVTVSDSQPATAAAIANSVARSLATVVPQLEPETNEGASPVRLSQVRQAQAPTQPASPSLPFNVAVGALIGLALGIAVSVIRTLLDNRVRTAKEAELICSAPAIGAIAYDAKARERPLIVHVDPLSPRAESFRALRTNLQFLDMGGRSSFVVTSSIPSEGKSTTTINLAIALADAGKRVALLDTDLRKPKVAEYLGIEGGVGLTDVLIGRAEVNDVMLPWGGRSLYVLPAGKIPPNPSELLGSARMETLITMFEKDFDIVLCDAPPLLPVTDAAILARVTSGALMVVAAGKTTRHQLSLAAEALGTVGAKLAGFVMSMVPTRGPDSYYSAYGYGYGYEYRDTTKSQGAKERRGRKQRRNNTAIFEEAAPHAIEELGFSPRRTSREATRKD